MEWGPPPEICTTADLGLKVVAIDEEPAADSQKGSEFGRIGKLKLKLWLVSMK